MIEIIDSTVQFVLTGICALSAVAMAIATSDRLWRLLSLFYNTAVLGDLYWLLYRVFLKDTPRFSIIPYLSWYSSFLFLWLLMVHLQDGKKLNAPMSKFWAVPLFTAAMSVFYMQYGAYLNNITIAVIMCVMLLRAITGLMDKDGPEDDRKRHRPIYSLTILFVAVEYALWTVSCFWSGETISNPYYWFDFLLTANFFFFLPATKKAVAA